MKTPRNQKKRTGGLSAFLGLPGRFAAWMRETWIGRFLHAYDKSREYMSECRVASQVRRMRLLRPDGPVRHGIGYLFTRSPIALFLESIGSVLRNTETRAYGILFGTFGIYTVLSYVIRYFAQWARGAEWSVLIAGILIMAFSLPLLVSRRPMYITMQENPILYAFFYRLVGLPQHPYGKKSRRGINPTVAFLIGSALGISSFFIHPLYPLAVLLGVWLFLLLFFSPEFCLYVTLLFCPLCFFFEHPALLLTVTVLIGMLGYTCKVLLGKRTFSFEPLDLSVLLLGLLYIGAVFFPRGGAASAREALLYATLLLGYFLAANLLTSSAAINRAIRSLVIGGGVTVTLGLLQFFTDRAVSDWLDSTAYAYISGRITAAFGNPNVLAAYLILLFPFVIAWLLKKKQALIGRVSALFLFFAFLFAILLTWSRGAWLGVILSFAVFLLSFHPATVYILVPAAVGSFAALQYGGTAIANRFASILQFASDSSVSYRIGTWRGTLSMALDHLFSGIGVGPASFRAVYPFYALSGMEAAPHAHNLLLQYLCEFGVAGPLLLSLFALLFFQCILSHREAEKNEELRLQSLAAGCAILSLLFFGLTDHIFYNARIFYLFFAVSGIGAAISRVGPLEQERRTPLHDTGAKYYALDVTVRED